MICVGVCDRMNTLYLLVEETEVISTSVKVYCACINSLRRSLNVSLEKYIRRILRARRNGEPLFVRGDMFV